MPTSGIDALGVAVKTSAALFLFFQLAGWTIALAGVAILQQNCNTHNKDFNFPAPAFGLGPNVAPDLIALAQSQGGTVPVVLAEPTGYDCGMQYSWYWWVLALQAITLLAGILVTFSVLKSGKLWVAAFYSIVTTLWCIFAYSTNWENYLYQKWGMDKQKDNHWGTGYVLGAAGSIIVLGGNFLFLYVLGTQDATGASAAEAGTTKETAEATGAPGTRTEAATTAV